MTALPKIHTVFGALSTDKRFDGLSMQLHRKVDYDGVLSYEIRVMLSAYRYSDDLDAFATVNAAGSSNSVTSRISPTGYPAPPSA